MESSKMFGGTEECHSSESGWTMYIGSPIHDDDDGNSSDAKAHNTAEDGGGGDDDDSDANDDDSMASDASSGPSHEMVRLKHGEDDEGDDGKPYSYTDKKKANKPVERVGRNNKRNNRSPKKDDKGDMAGSSAAPSQSGSKVRKSFWHSKRK